MSKKKTDSDRPTTLEPEIFLSQHRRISDWLLKADEFKASGKAALNTAKATGVNLDAYKMVKKWAKQDREQVEKNLRDALLMARLLDLGLFDQMDLFASETNSALSGLTAKVMTDHKEWEAERAGYDEGKSGSPLDNNPHAPGSPLHERFIVGWHGGNAFQQQAEARGEQIIKPRRGSSNPEDTDE